MSAAAFKSDGLVNLVGDILRHRSIQVVTQMLIAAFSHIDSGNYDPKPDEKEERKKTYHLPEDKHVES